LTRRDVIEVTKEQFYEFVNPRDIVIKSDWKKPIMSTEFKFRTGAVVGKVTTDYEDDTDEWSYGNGTKKYFLKEQYLNQENTDGTSI
jgi:hypothetical protein